MNIFAIILFIGLMAFTIYQSKLLIDSIKARKKAQPKNDASPINTEVKAKCEKADKKTLPNKDKGV